MVFLSNTEDQDSIYVSRNKVLKQTLMIEKTMFNNGINGVSLLSSDLKAESCAISTVSWVCLELKKRERKM